MLKGALVIALSLLLGWPAARAAGAQTPAAGAGVALLSGGIGEDEQRALAAREKEFNLKLVFSLVQGNYIAGVGVVIWDAKGASIVEHIAQGPIFLARLPAGRYQVAATYLDRTVTRQVTVAAGRLRTEYLRWPSHPEDDLPVSRWLERQ